MCNTGFSEIHNLTDKEQWRFYPGPQNPTDLPSRGCSGEELVCNPSWWRGPEFLCQPQLVKHSPVLIHALTTSEANPITVNLDKVIDITRYSSKIKLLRVTATVIKVAQFWMNKGKPWTHVEAGDLNKAEERWVQTMQQNCFSEY